jgi:glucosamine--fructose-6-phosphate aminotransferase (isomerizing)
MCGIFGIFTQVQSEKVKIDSKDFKLFSNIGLKSRIRGVDASGIMFGQSGSNVQVIKGNVDLRKLLKEVSRNSHKSDNNFFVGHTRYATHGTRINQNNNHPVVSQNWLVIHNGWITNFDEIKQNTPLKNWGGANTSVDSFAINSVLEGMLSNSDEFSHQDFSQALNRLKGEISLFAIHKSGRSFLYTNVGNIYIFQTKDRILFASQPEFFQKKHAKFTSQLSIKKVYELPTVKISGSFDVKFMARSEVVDFLPNESSQYDEFELREILIQKLNLLNSSRKELSHCSNCLIPETFPNIKFNSEGECQHCTNYKPTIPMSVKQLSEMLNAASPTRQIVFGLSGGRDSCYLAHLLSTQGFKPIAVTYDWGLISNDARENMANISGILGIEHLLITRNSDLIKKRVRRSLEEVLKSHDYRFIPLLMAGDKFWLRAVQNIAKRRKNLPVVMGMQKYENTGFKTIGLLESDKFYLGNTNSSISLSFAVLIKMVMSYLIWGLRQPSVLPILFTEGLYGFYYYYFFNSKIISPFNLIDYNPNDVESILQINYDYKFNKIGSHNTWRAGDMTSHLYDILYFIKLQFTEQDIMISNLIRSGKITKADGIKRINNLNRANLELVKSYSEYLSIDFSLLLKKIIDF